MSPESVWPAISGPLGALAVMALVIMAVVKWRVLVPGYIYESAEKRLAELDRENAELNHSVIELNRHVSRLEAETEGLRRDLRVLRSELGRLRKEVDGS